MSAAIMDVLKAIAAGKGLELHRSTRGGIEVVDVARWGHDEATFESLDELEAWLRKATPTIIERYRGAEV